jgi:hypothetical protein
MCHQPPTTLFVLRVVATLQNEENSIAVFVHFNISIIKFMLVYLLAITLLLVVHLDLQEVWIAKVCCIAFVLACPDLADGKTERSLHSPSLQCRQIQNGLLIAARCFYSKSTEDQNNNQHHFPSAPS